MPSAKIVELRPELTRKPEPISPAPLQRELRRAQLAYALDDDEARQAFADFARAVAGFLRQP